MITSQSNKSLNPSPEFWIFISFLNLLYKAFKFSGVSKGFLFHSISNNETVYINFSPK